MALVYGRRRQGKTLMLELLAEATGGFMFTGMEQSAAQNLADLRAAHARHLGLPAPLALNGWREMVDALLALGERAPKPIPVILDEFPYLLDSDSALAAIIQTALSPRGRARTKSRARLILCGSALTTMRGLLGGSAPLRGRASMELMLHPFGFRDAAVLWGMKSTPELAFRVNALVGGTPAYREMCVDAPGSLRDFDDWVARRLLSPSSALFREGSILLQEDPRVTDPVPYFGVLAAISRGQTRRGEIASALARPDSALAHPLDVLEQLQLVARLEDAFRRKRATYRILEPVIRFHQLVIRPNEARLVRRAAREVWADVSDTVSAHVYGPHLEDLGRAWCLEHASAETLGGQPTSVLPAVLSCRSHRQTHEVDLVALRSDPQSGERVLALGEVKAWSRPLDRDSLARLEHLRELLPPNAVTAPPVLVLISRAGFTRRLRTDARGRSDVQLVDLERLYSGE